MHRDGMAGANSLAFGRQLLPLEHLFGQLNFLSVEKIEGTKEICSGRWHSGANTVRARTHPHPIAQAPSTRQTSKGVCSQMYC